MIRSEDDIYVRFIRRVTQAIVVIGISASATAAAVRGWRYGLGVLLGACISYVSFWRWQRVVEAIGPKATVKRSVVSLLVRFAVLAAALYVMIKHLEVNPVAVFLGLLVAAAAVLVSIVLELIYAPRA